MITLPPPATRRSGSASLRIAFQPAGSPPVNFDLVSLSAVLVEEGDAGEAGDSAH